MNLFVYFFSFTDTLIHSFIYPFSELNNQAALSVDLTTNVYENPTYLLIWVDNICFFTSYFRGFIFSSNNHSLSCPRPNLNYCLCLVVALSLSLFGLLSSAVVTFEFPISFSFPFIRFPTFIMCFSYYL